MHSTAPALKLQDPWLAVALTKVTPGGSGSLTDTPRAAFGPRFVTLSV